MFSPSAELPVASWAPGPRPRVTGGDWRQDCVQVTLALGGGGGAGPTCGSAPPGLSCFLNRACVRLSAAPPRPDHRFLRLVPLRSASQVRVPARPLSQ